MQAFVDDIGVSDGRTDFAADHLAPLGHPELEAKALRKYSLKLSEQGRLFFTTVVLAQPLHRTADVARVAETHDMIAVFQRTDRFIGKSNLLLPGLLLVLAGFSRDS